MKDDAPAQGAGAGQDAPLKLPSRHFSKYPHALHDALITLSGQGHNLSGACYLIVLTIVRHTYGWQREWWQASSRDMVEATGFSRRTIKTAVATLLEDFGLIERRPVKNSFEYRVNPDADERVKTSTPLKTDERVKDATPKGCTSPGHYEDEGAVKDATPFWVNDPTPFEAENDCPEGNNLNPIDKIDSKRLIQGEKTSGERSTASEVSDDEQARALQHPTPILLDEAFTHEPDTIERRILSAEFDGVPGHRHDGVGLTNLGPWLRRVVDRGDTGTVTAWEVRCPHISLPVCSPPLVQTPSSPSQLAA